MILLLRHLEAEKNIQKRFSTIGNLEKLTCNGLNMGSELAHFIESFVRKNNYRVKEIYCANSTRAVETAKLIADKLSVKICAFDELCSNNSGVLRGRSEDEAKELNPTFMKQLKLFRAGIYSSYDFDKVSERENKYEFEKRVNECLEKIIRINGEDLKIVVLHHSSLTAVVINFARKFYNYPLNYYGRVACELGNIYLIGVNEIILCNEHASALEEVIAL